MKEALSTTQAPAAIGPYSQGVKASGETVYVSGQLPIDPATGEMPQGVEAQAERSFSNVEAILAATGLTLADVVKTTVLLADISDFAAVNAVYARRFSAPYPARSAFAVAALPKPGALLEVEAVAVR